MKLVHLFHDDKFIDYTIMLFDKARPYISSYYVFKKEKKPFKYVKSEKVKRLDSSNKTKLDHFINEINADVKNVLLLHSLSNEHLRILSRLDSSITKVWFVWGFDLYGNWPIYRKKILTKRTRELTGIKTSFFYNLLVNPIGFTLIKSRAIFPKKYRAKLENVFNFSFYQNIKRIDYVTTVVPNEYELVKRINPKIKYLPFNYVSVEGLMSKNEEIKDAVSKNILIGNSADPANNHIDIFEKLSTLNLEGRRIYVPLSYGGNQDYISEIIKRGYELLPDSFEPMIDFLTLEEYNKILSSCGIFIFNHIRQQALGNIIYAGYSGARIFLNKKSPVYEFLRSQNIDLFNVDQLSNKSLTSNFDSINNTESFFKLYSEHTVLDRVNELISTLENAQ